MIRNDLDRGLQSWWRTEGLSLIRGCRTSDEPCGVSTGTVGIGSRSGGSKQSRVGQLTSTQVREGVGEIGARWFRHQSLTLRPSHQVGRG